MAKYKYRAEITKKPIGITLEQIILQLKKKGYIQMSETRLILDKDTFVLEGNDIAVEGENGLTIAQEYAGIEILIQEAIQEVLEQQETKKEKKSEEADKREER